MSTTDKNVRRSTWGIIKITPQNIKSLLNYEITNSIILNSYNDIDVSKTDRKYIENFFKLKLG
jgi:hypothetical protein